MTHVAEGAIQGPTVELANGASFVIRLLAGRDFPPTGRPVPTRNPQSGLLHLDADGLKAVVDDRRVNFFVDENCVLLWSGTPGLPGAEEGRDFAVRLARAIAVEGDIAFERLRGRYAVVRIDLQRREIGLATDRFAVHPICYGVSGDHLVASDRADEVARQTGASVRLQSLHDYLYFHVIPSPATVFEGVFRVEPSQVVRLSAVGPGSRFAWAPAFGQGDGQALGALRTRFVALVESAVRRELDGAAYGAFLSGGTDSSTVAGMLCRLGRAPAATYSIGFADEGYDEMAYARIAARHFGTRHTEYYVTPEDLLAFIPDVAAHYDQPFGNSSALPAYCCERLAVAEGIRTMFAGDGGDELFGGNTRYAKQKIFDAYTRIPAGVRTRLLEPAFAGRSPLRRAPLLRKIGSYIEQARVPMPARMETYNLLDRFGRAAVFAESVAARVDDREPGRLQKRIYDGCADPSLVNRMLAYDWRFTLADTDLPKVTGTASLAGVRAAFPLLDDDLVDFSMALPARLKVRGLQLRWFFKHALRDFLPDEIIRKKKHGFGLPFGPWVVRHPRLRDFARDSIDGLVQRRLIRPEFADTLFSTHLSEHPGYYGEMIWILMMLEQWLRSRAPRYSAAT